MTTVRLAVYMKDTIRAELLDRRFKAEREALARDWGKFGDDLYKALYPADLLKKMKVLPEGFLPKTYSLSFKFGGDIKHVSWGDGNDYRIVSADHSDDVAAVFLATDTFTDTFRDLKARSAKRKEEEKQLRAEINAALNASTTLNALVAKWPEVAPFVEPFMRKAKKSAQLPVIQTDVLNKALDLPVTKDKPAHEKKPPKKTPVIKKGERRPVKKVRRA